MNLDLAAEVLGTALIVRAPRFSTETRDAEKVDRLQDYMLATAYLDGELVEAKHFLRNFIAEKGREWDAIDTSAALSTSRPKKEQVTQARITLAPTLYEELRRANRVRDGIEDQIARLDRDATKVSRVYTMLSA